jgi:hypothetical protein
MATEIEQREMTLAYDGDCPMCLSTVAMLKRLGLVAPEQAVSNHDLSTADLATAQAAGIRNQLVVLDPRSNEVRAGADGLLWIIGRNRGNPLWVRGLSLPGLRHLLSLGYETISYNRRVISPPRHAVRCDCEPEVTVGRRMKLVVPLLMLTVPLTALFGAAVFVGWNLGDAIRGAVFMEVAAGVGWIAMAAAALVLLRGEQRVDYLAHLAVTALVGVLVLLPASVLTWWLPVPVGVLLAGVSVLVSFALMFQMQRRRTAAVGLSQRWLWAWVGWLLVGFVGTVLVNFGQGVLL